MLDPKNTSVGLAGQKAWHVCAGEAAPRISGKYLPSQLRTQKAGPELATTSPGGGGCGLLLQIWGKQKGWCCRCWILWRRGRRPSDFEACPRVTAAALQSRLQLQ